MRKHAVCLHVTHVIALQGGLIGNSFSNVALAGAGLANEQPVDALGDELQGVQLKARLARHLRVEVPIKVCQRQPLIKPTLLETPLCYQRTLIPDLESDYLVADSWENYDRMATVIDQRYAKEKDKHWWKLW